MPREKEVLGDNLQPCKENLYWSEEMDIALLNALTDELVKGNRVDGVWTTTAYHNVLTEMRSTIDQYLTKQHIKNRMKTMKDNFAEAYDLFNSLSGFSWNPQTTMFEAEDKVWAALIREKPYAEKWRRLQLKNYDTLKELFGADRDTDRGALTAAERVRRWERETIDSNDSFESTEMPNADFQPNLEEFSLTYGQSTHSVETSSSRGTKRKTRMGDLVEAQLEKVVSSITTLAEVIKDGNDLAYKLGEVAERQVTVAKRHLTLVERQVQVAEKSLSLIEQTRPRHYSESAVWDLLNSLGVQDPYRMQCYRFLCGNDQLKRELFGVPVEFRLEALLQMMTNAGLH